jgi:hypothetical protein
MAVKWLSLPCVVPGPGASKICWRCRKLWSSFLPVHAPGSLKANVPVLLLRAVHATPHDTAVTNNSITVARSLLIIMSESSSHSNGNSTIPQAVIDMSTRTSPPAKLTFHRISSAVWAVSTDTLVIYEHRFLYFPSSPPRNFGPLLTLFSPFANKIKKSVITSRFFPIQSIHGSINDGI